MSTIEIHSGRLVEWIVTRLKLNKDWRTKVNVIRQKITKALSDMPENEEIFKILAGTYINYFHCLKILNILKETESESRNIFGQYSSKRYKDWQEIVKLYEQSHSYLVDCSQILHQNVAFELPAIRKSIEKHNKTIIESERKTKLYKSSSNEATNNLKQLSEKYHVTLLNLASISDESTSIRQQLKQSTSQIPELLGGIGYKINNLNELYKLYVDFVAYMMGKEQSDLVCPMVKYLLKNGNTSVYEYKYGKKLIEIEEEGNTDKCEEIESTETTESIKYDDGAGDEIQWDDGIDMMDGDDVAEDICIDFGIELDDGDQQEEREESNNDIPHTKLVDSKEKLSLCENIEMRELLLDDLFELSSFLSASLDANNSVSVLDSIDDTNDKWSDQLHHEKVKKMMSFVNQFIDLLTNKNLTHLIMLQSSETYVQSIVTKFTKETVAHLKYDNLIGLMKQRVQESSYSIVELEGRMESLRHHCKQLKSQIEESISKQFNNRPIKIVGEVLTI